MKEICCCISLTLNLEIQNFYHPTSVRVFFFNTPVTEWEQFPAAKSKYPSRVGVEVAEQQERLRYQNVTFNNTMESHLHSAAHFLMWSINIKQLLTLLDIQERSKLKLPSFYPLWIIRASTKLFLLPWFRVTIQHRDRRQQNRKYE